MFTDTFMKFCLTALFNDEFDNKLIEVHFISIYLCHNLYSIGLKRSFKKEPYEFLDTWSIRHIQLYINGYSMGIFHTRAMNNLPSLSWYAASYMHVQARAYFIDYLIESVSCIILIYLLLHQLQINKMIKLLQHHYSSQHKKNIRKVDKKINLWSILCMKNKNLFFYFYVKEKK